MKNKLLFLILLSFFTTSSFSQNIYEFLRLDMSARAGALAGSFVSNDDDPDVIFYNPSGIRLLEGNPVSISYVSHLLDLNLASVSYSTEINNAGRIGAAVKYINYGTFTQADEFGNKEGEFNAGDIAFIIGYANNLDENFFYGINGKYIYSSIAGISSSGIAADLGLHYADPENQLNIGFAILNLGTQISPYIESKENLPVDVVIGISKSLAHLPLTLSLDFHKLNEERENFGETFKAFTVGAEFIMSRVLRLRLGYDNEKRKELKIGTTAGVAGFNIGVGLVISDYNFDYGFSSMGSIGGLHRISVSTNL